jgi:lysosomal Pro-X carboxypeptidase
MWETAPAFGAALVFAEHRFYGASKPRSPAWSDAHLRFLTAEQAMADYAELVAELRGGGIEGAADSPVIVFGGSYGGMLATWLRLKYPSSFDGAIAGSAPIWTFEGEEPPYDGGSFAATVTRDATPAAGAAPACADNVRAAFAALLASHRTRHGAQDAKTALRLCPSVRLRGAADAAAVADWVSGAFDSMAMGNYPYPSSYLLNGDATLPAWPMRAACGKLATPGLTGVAALTALGDAVSIYFNATGTVDCHGAAGTGSDATDDDGRLWGWQYCTEMFMPMWRDGVRDMFYAQPWDAAAAAAACEAAWGVAPRRGWADVEFGGRRIGAITNVVFSNGLYDPWSGGGVLADVNPTAVAVTIPEGGHHLDLMFAHEADPDSVKRARETQRAHIARWVAEKGERVAAGREGVATV